MSWIKVMEYKKEIEKLSSQLNDSNALLGAVKRDLDSAYENAVSFHIHRRSLESELLDMKKDCEVWKKSTQNAIYKRHEMQKKVEELEVQLKNSLVICEERFHMINSLSNQKLVALNEVKNHEYSEKSLREIIKKNHQTIDGLALELQELKMINSDEIIINKKDSDNMVDACNYAFDKSKDRPKVAPNGKEWPQVVTKKTKTVWQWRTRWNISEPWRVRPDLIEEDRAQYYFKNEIRPPGAYDLAIEKHAGPFEISL